MKNDLLFSSFIHAASNNGTSLLNIPLCLVATFLRPLIDTQVFGTLQIVEFISTSFTENLSHVRH